MLAGRGLGQCVDVWIQRRSGWCPGPAERVTMSCGGGSSSSFSPHHHCELQQVSKLAMCGKSSGSFRFPEILMTGSPCDEGLCGICGLRDHKENRLAACLNENCNDA